MHRSEGNIYIYSRNHNINKNCIGTLSLDNYREYLEEDKDKENFLVICPIPLMDWLDTEEKM